MSETAVALRGRDATLPSQSEWSTMLAISAELVKSGLLPRSVDTPQKAAVIALKGRELGVPMLYALANIVLVQGKPTCQAELMLALLYRDHGDEALQVEESTAAVCRVAYKRRNWTARRTYAFTIEEAQRAQLTSKDTWKQYPAAMLRARCISAVARMAFPDSIGGMYSYEEMGVPVDVHDDQVVIQDVAPAANGRTSTMHEPPAGVLRESTDVADRRRLYQLLADDPEAAAKMDAALAAKNTSLDKQDMAYVRKAIGALEERATNRVIDASASDQAEEPDEEPDQAVDTSVPPTGVLALEESMAKWWRACLAKASTWLDEVGSHPDGAPYATDMTTGRAILVEQAKLLGKDLAGPTPTGSEAMRAEIARRWALMGATLEQRTAVSTGSTAADEVAF